MFWAPERRRRRRRRRWCWARGRLPSGRTMRNTRPPDLPALSDVAGSWDSRTYSRRLAPTRSGALRPDRTGCIDLGPRRPLGGALPLTGILLYTGLPPSPYARNPFPALIADRSPLLDNYIRNIGPGPLVVVVCSALVLVPAPRGFSPVEAARESHRPPRIDGPF